MSTHFLPICKDYSLQKLARDSEVALGVHINYYRSRSPFYISILEEFARVARWSFGFLLCLPSTV
ncbi:hypothetical protein EPI10_024324 [Gossypium australe]|uniref:Uncharacterized protein n=1 Tax=Gossypium australe TaxID=47621 RepID=A0A5B6VWM5_9ROSI|nr:hypothetical protein EPI10_024324 [Gossypium australe]